MTWTIRTIGSAGARIQAAPDACAAAMTGPAGDIFGFGIGQAIAREAMAPPPLGRLPGSTMLAVASVYGKIPEEWQPAGPHLFMAWPHAAGAELAVEMTAAQLRDWLAAMDGGHE
jgi:hypothetical protein